MTKIIKNEFIVDKGDSFPLMKNIAVGAAPWQYLREYVQNGIDAFALLPSGLKKQIYVDFDHHYYDVHKIFKLAFGDTGVGMSPHEAEKYLLNFGRTTSSRKKNKGIGARISAIRRNKELWVKTWPVSEGGKVGYLLILEIDLKVGGQLKRFPDGAKWKILSEEDKPHFIDKCGTQVTFMGHFQKDDTMLPPSSCQFPIKEWMAQTLNNTYFDIDKDIHVYCRTNHTFNKEAFVWDNQKRMLNMRQTSTGGGQNRLVKIPGCHYTYENIKKKNGTLTLSDDTVIHWYITETREKKHSFFSRNKRSRIAYLHNKECYEVKYGSQADFHKWGVHYCSNVSLFIELDSNFYRPDVARKYLTVGGEEEGDDLPKARWQAEFKENFPNEIKKEEEETSRIDDSKGLDPNILKNLPFIKDDLAKTSEEEGEPMDLQENIDEAMTKAARYSMIMKEQTNNKKKGEIFGDLEDYIHKRKKESSPQKGLPVEANFMPKNTKHINPGEDHKLYGWAVEYVADEDLVLINDDWRGIISQIDCYMPKSTNPVLAKTLKSLIMRTHVDRAILMICQAKQLRDSTMNIGDFEASVSTQALTIGLSPNVQTDRYLKQEIKKITM